MLRGSFHPDFKSGLLPWSILVSKSGTGRPSPGNSQLGKGVPLRVHVEVDGPMVWASLSGGIRTRDRNPLGCALPAELPIFTNLLMFRSNNPLLSRVDGPHI